jgi:hypothetical protein
MYSTNKRETLKVPRTLLSLFAQVIAFFAMPWIGAFLGMAVKQVFVVAGFFLANLIGKPLSGRVLTFLTGFIGYFTAMQMTHLCFRWLSIKPHWLLLVGLLVKSVLMCAERIGLLGSERMRSLQVYAARQGTAASSPELDMIGTSGDISAIILGWICCLRS